MAVADAVLCGGIGDGGDIAAPKPAPILATRPIFRDASGGEPLTLNDIKNLARRAGRRKRQVT